MLWLSEKYPVLCYIIIIIILLLLLILLTKYLITPNFHRTGRTLLWRIKRVRAGEK